MNQNKNTKKKRKGFTLIELIIVLAIMAIIAGIAIPNFTSIRDNAKTKADTQSAETIKRTVLMLVADETIKPDATDPKEANVTVNATSGAVTVANTGAASTAAFTTTATTGEIAQLTTALHDVKAPQVSGRSGFRISVSTAGNVTVTPY